MHDDTTHLPMVTHCMVCLPDGPSPQDRYLVRKRWMRDGEAWVTLAPLGAAQQVIDRPQREVDCGFVPGHPVVAYPLTETHRKLGGEVLCVRTLGGRTQAMVQFDDSGTCRWVAFERLAMQRDARALFAQMSECGEPGDAERFRLKALAWILERWNENTGALSRLDIDPLPHQLHLVHHILRSGTCDWLIADDVGLGKTIEVGMLLAALTQRRDFSRILIVTPAGLTRQWQEELTEKFGMDDFVIYGRDVSIHQPSHWRLYPRMIASIDRLKADGHRHCLTHADDWDLVIFDEAHKLTRTEYGTSYDASQRFQLASQLRPHTAHMLLLTATPHQGRTDRFRALLELIRPEWTERFDDLEAKPEMLRECVYRNHKEDVTDQHGAFIFHGQDTHAVPIDISAEEAAFDDALCHYFEEGYATAETMSAQMGRAVGFVMTTFRKLAASSHPAILTSLKRRRDNLLDEQIALEEARAAALDEGDTRFAGEHDEHALQQYIADESFFDGELAMLDDLVEMAEGLLAQDSKLEAFLGIVEDLTAHDPERKLLVFTEFRTTQTYLYRALASRFGEEAVGLIHGSLSLDEKREAVRGFRDDLQFLISTEAGGEGLNLHHRCHTLLNYDLPWNPMRLVQRTGRLYRYGQTERVQVFNLHAPDTLDGRVLDLLYSRIERVVAEMGGLGEEFHDELHLEILGEIAELADIEAILTDATHEDEARTTERIDEALDRARSASALQRELLAHAQSYDPEELAGELQLTQRHLDSFVEGMLRQCGCPILDRQHDGKVWRVQLTDEMRDVLDTQARTIRVTTYREHGRYKDVRMLDFGDALFCELIARARSHGFGGTHAVARGLDHSDVVGITHMMWQSERGQRMREEVVAMRRTGEGDVMCNGAEVADWLATPVRDADRIHLGAEERRAAVHDMMLASQQRLAARANRQLHPMLFRLKALCGIQ